MTSQLQKIEGTEYEWTPLIQAKVKERFPGGDGPSDRPYRIGQTREAVRNRKKVSRGQEEGTTTEEKAELPFRGSNVVWLVFGKRIKKCLSQIKATVRESHTIHPMKDKIQRLHLCCSVKTGGACFTNVWTVLLLVEATSERPSERWT